MIYFSSPLAITSPLPPLLATIAICLAAALITLVLCAYALRIAGGLKLLDVPTERKKHRTPTPLMGGLVILGAVLPASVAWTALMVPDDWRAPMALWIGATLAMTLLGLVDDRVQLSARLRLGIASAVIAFVASSNELYNIRFLQFENPQFAFGFGNLPLSVAFTTVCMVGFANAVNMADGKNGLILGLSIMWAVLLGIRSPAPMWPYYGVMTCVMLVMLAFNLRGRLFLGDGGSYGIATAIGLFALMIYNQAGWHADRRIAAEELILLFFVPVADFFRVIFTRLIRGKSPFSPGRDHLHHILLDRFAWPSSLCVYYALTLIPVCLIWAFDQMPENYGTVG